MDYCRGWKSYWVDTSYMSKIKKIEDEDTLNSLFEDAVKSNSIEEFKEKLKLRKLN
ncbi:hypothetical protein ACYUJ6_05035 [Clostridium sp. JNZ X4-2]